MAAPSEILALPKQMRVYHQLYTAKLDLAYEQLTLNDGLTYYWLFSAKPNLESYQQTLQQDTDDLAAYEAALLDISQDYTVQQYRNTLSRLDISLTVSSAGLGAGDQGWDQGDGSEAGLCAKRAYRAVYNIITRIGDTLYEGDNVLGAVQFAATFGGSLLENERIANMFEAFVTGYQPELDSINATQRRGAWAMWTFMSGVCPPTDVDIDLTGQVRPCGEGIMHWVDFYGN